MISARRSRLRPALLAACAAGAVGLAALHLSYPLPYVYRVLVYQDADYSDIDWQPARTIAASGAASELPVALDPRVAEVFEQRRAVESAEFTPVASASPSGERIRSRRCPAASYAVRCRRSVLSRRDSQGQR